MSAQHGEQRPLLLCSGTLCHGTSPSGYAKSEKAWRENARVKFLKVSCNGEPMCILELQNSRSLQTFNVEVLLDKHSSKTIRFEILDVYPGTKYLDTAISEIYFYGYGI